jgi:hypothetical protein
MKMPDRLKSRKLWLTLFTQILVVIIVGVMELPEEQATNIAQWIVATASAYLVGQGYADGQAAKKSRLTSG